MLPVSTNFGGTIRSQNQAKAKARLEAADAGEKLPPLRDGGVVFAAMTGLGTTWAPLLPTLVRLAMGGHNIAEAGDG